MSILLEICANSLDSALAAQNACAHRIELCANLRDGGITPSYGTIQVVLRHLTIPVFVLIRPRPGNFVYTDEEFEIMKEDVLICKKLGCKGVVIGLLTLAGQVDVKRTKELVDLVKPMEVTFHRAFDYTIDPYKALEDIILSGCHRILTSGQKNNAYEGKDLIKEMIIKANDRIIIMPGSGINENNLCEVIHHTNAKEVHASAKATVSQPKMLFENKEIQNMGEELEISSEIKISLLLRKIKSMIQ